MDMTSGDPAKEATLLFDDQCGFCRWSLDKILAWDRHDRLRPVAIQSDEGQSLLASVPEELRLDSFHLAEPSGEVFSAGAALAPLFARLPGGRGPCALARRFPGAAERAYRAIASRRDRWARMGASRGPS